MFSDRYSTWMCEIKRSFQVQLMVTQEKHKSFCFAEYATLANVKLQRVTHQLAICDSHTSYKPSYVTIIQMLMNTDDKASA